MRSRCTPSSGGDRPQGSVQLVEVDAQHARPHAIAGEGAVSTIPVQVVR